MQDNNNIWDKFNEPNLEGEDWLEPKESVFKNIENEIFTQSEPKKTKNKFGFLWLFAGGLIAFTLGFLYIQSIDNSSQTLEEISMTESPLKSKATSTTLSEQKSSKSTVKTYQESNAKRTSDAGASFNEKSQNKNKKSTITTKAKEVIQRPTSQGPENTITSNSKSILDRKSITQNNYLSDNFKKENLPSTVNTYNPKKVTTLNHPEKFDRPIIRQSSTFHIILDPIVPENILEFEIANSFMSPISKDKEELDSNTESSSWLRLKFGYSKWNFNLNDNYSSALNPADFYSSEAQGFNVSLGYGKRINKLIDLNVDFSFNNVSLESGHNSQLAYQLAEEQDQANSFTLLMATPLGFINSEVEINRVDQNITEAETDFGVGLINQHKITSLGIEPSLNFNLVQSKSLSIGPNVGMGLFYLNKISNQLAEVNSLHDAFESSDFRITEGQQNINRILTTVNLGIQAEYLLDEKIKIGAAFDYKLPFQSSFNDQMDFSSTITQSASGIYLKYLLN